MNGPRFTQRELEAYIGPPLRPVFARLLNSTDPAIPEAALAYYRERYSVIGLTECEVYPGIEPMLVELRRSGHRLYVATSKPTVYAIRILKHFELAGYFDGIYGSELDGKRDDKAELIQYVVDTETLIAADCAMVGDRRFDIIGALAAGLTPVGVTYGFGSREELEEAGARYISESPAQTLQVISSMEP